MKITRGLLLVFVSVVLVSCRPSPSSQPLTTEIVNTVSPAPAETQPAGAEEFGETTIIENVIVADRNTRLESVVVVIEGFFPDGCTQIAEVMQSCEKKVCTIRLMTIRPEDAICTAALEPFTIPVALDVSGLKAGQTYQVVVYDHVLEFENGRADEPEERGG